MGSRQFTLITGDICLAVKTLGSIDCVVTSPPYYQQRDYLHKKQIGQEGTVEQYVDKLVKVFSNIRKVMNKNGTLFINMADKYVNQSLLGAPWRLALAMIDDGWVLRNEVIWKKNRIMPQSAKNRFTPEHEQVFFFTIKRRGYTFNSDAVRQPAKWAHDRRAGKGRHVYKESRGENGHTAAVSIAADGKRIRRSVWEIETSQTDGQHAATFPVGLPEICILAGSNKGDTVLDPFSGMASVGVAAIKHGRKYVGVEVSRKFNREARRRLS